MQTDKILEQIFSKRKPSLREMIRQAIADLPQESQRVVRDRFKDVHFCVLALINYRQFPARDAIDGTIAAIDFNDPNFVLVFDAIAANSPKRYIANPLPD